MSTVNQDTPHTAPPVDVPNGPPPGTGTSSRALLARLPRYQQIAEDLREQIHTGVLAPGEPLPSETVLIDRYGVSRITVRAAVRALRAAGLVITEHGRATYVRLAPTQPVDLDLTIRRVGDRFHTWED